jgi:hypothetical protein
MGTRGDALPLFHHELAVSRRDFLSRAGGGLGSRRRHLSNEYR